VDIYWTTATGDELRIAEVDTGHPRLQTSDRAEGWKDCHPRNYPLCLFALVVSLLGALSDLELLDDPAVVDCGVQTEEG
jgi:hypothetical protein